MKNSALIGIAGLAVIASVASADIWYTGAGTSLVEGTSNNGVASSSFNPFNAGAGYSVWTASGGFQAIGGVSPGNGVGGQAKISADGRYISGTTFNAAMGYHEMSRYDMQTGQWTGFGMVPGVGTQIDAEVSSGWAVSGDGRSVAGLGWTTLGSADTHAFQWTEGVGPIDLGSASIGNSARVNGLDHDGNVAVGWQDGAGRQGSVWVDGAQELIFDNGGQAAQEAFAVSGDGRWAVGLGIGGFFAPGNAYRYDIENDQYIMIDNLAVGAERLMAASSVNGDGTLIGGGTWGFGPATLGNAFIWQDGIGTMTVGDFLDMNGINYDETFHFSFVSAISEDGNWIAGWGFDELSGPGTLQSFIINIPAPGAMGAIAMGGLLAARRRR